MTAAVPFKPALVGAFAHHAHHHPHRRPRPRMLGPVIASWYYDQGFGRLGCGFYSPDGVATLAYPCGTRFRICSHTRCTDAVRDDSGPYVPGRMFDLGLNVRNALACAGLCTVTYQVNP